MIKARPSGRMIRPLTCGFGVELRGLEPLTPTLPVWCATSCATAPCARTTVQAGGSVLVVPWSLRWNGGYCSGSLGAARWSRGLVGLVGTAAAAPWSGGHLERPAPGRRPAPGAAGTRAAGTRAASGRRAAAHRGRRRCTAGWGQPGGAAAGIPEPALSTRRRRAGSSRAGRPVHRVDDLLAVLPVHVLAADPNGGGALDTLLAERSVGHLLGPGDMGARAHAG